MAGPWAAVAVGVLQTLLLLLLEEEEEVYGRTDPRGILNILIVIFFAFWLSPHDGYAARKRIYVPDIRHQHAMGNFSSRRHHDDEFYEDEEHPHRQRYAPYTINGTHGLLLRVRNGHAVTLFEKIPTNNTYHSQRGIPLRVSSVSPEERLHLSSKVKAYIPTAGGGRGPEGTYICLTQQQNGTLKELYVTEEQFKASFVPEACAFSFVIVFFVL